MNIELTTLASFDDIQEVIILPVSPRDTRSEQTSKKPQSKVSSNPFAALTPETRSVLEKFNEESNGDFSRRLKKIAYSPSATERTDVPVQLNGEIRILRLSGLPKEAFSLKDSSRESWRKLGGDAVRAAKKMKAASVGIALTAVSRELLGAVIQAVTEGIQLGEYEFSKYKSGEKKASASKQKFSLLLRERPSRELSECITRAKGIADAVIFARDLVNTPPADMLPKDLVAAAKEVKSAVRGATLKIFGEQELKKMKANLLLCVAAGSASKPYLIHLSRPARSASAKKIVLVGKGVAFDSGGLCIKPGKSMEEMKCDMAGAAAVLGAFKAFAALGRTDIELHAIVPTTENSISGPAVRPGDVVRSMSGKTVEVLNTDAEGRLILADAFTYAQKLNPDLMIDLATLTGACIVALGDDYAGLFTHDKELRDSMIEAGRLSGELLWPLPLAKEYKGQLKGQVGDLRNIGSGSGGGATLGALFLEEFVPRGTRWAHIDIAGPAFLSRGGDYSVPGATGFGVRTLLSLLENF